MDLHKSKMVDYDICNPNMPCNIKTEFRDTSEFIKIDNINMKPRKKENKNDK